MNSMDNMGNMNNMGDMDNMGDMNNMNSGYDDNNLFSRRSDFDNDQHMEPFHNQGWKHN